MTSKIKVDNINKVSDDSNIIKKCGTTTTIGSGASNPIVVDGSAVTIGRCGGTVALASGASQTGFGREGSVNWQTGSLKTSTFTAVSGEGYFINSGSAITANLPAGSAGAIVAFSDYARNFATYNLTISANGSEKIGGETSDAVLNIAGQAATFVYVDSTKGWINVQNAEDTEIGVSPYVTATGGTITTSGNFKIHTFTGPGSFAVTSAGSAAPGSGTGSNLVDYIVVAGGGGAGGNQRHIQGGGGGGGGGFRASPGTASGCYTASPRGAAPAVSLSVPIATYPITVGGGGTGGQAACSPSISSPGAAGTSGASSTFSTITSAGGGRGAQPNSNPPAPASGGGAAETGGSGGGQGGGNSSSGASGNTPPTNPAQGSSGGNADTTNYTLGGGGGGATAAGGSATGPCTGGGLGGAGATSCITAGPVTYSTGGNSARPAPEGAAGNAAVNTGNGGPANNYYPSPTSPSKPYYDSFNGGSGIVVIRYKYQN